MDYKTEWAATDSIDKTNFFYRITTPHGKPPIDASISRMGLLSPVVVKKEPEHLIVVSGFRRLESCCRLKWPRIPCHILPEDASTISCAEIAITENLTQRPLNVVEQAQCLRLLDDSGCGHQESMTIAQALGLSLNLGYAAKLRMVHTCSEAIQDGLVQGILSLPIVALLAELPKKDADALALIFIRLPMGLNKQREILHHLKEIAARDGLPIMALFEEEELRDILARDEMDGNWKARQIRSYLKKRRYPRLVDAEERFNAYIRQLDLGTGVKIQPPPYFEGPTYTMTIRFDGLDALKRESDTIARAITDPMASKLFNLI